MIKPAVQMCKLSIFLFALCTNLLAPLVLGIGRDFNLGLQQCGMLFLVFYAGNCLACLFCGRLLGRFGKARALGASLFAMAGLCGLMALSLHVLFLLAVLFSLGFSTLIIQVAGTSIPSDLSEDNAASAVTGVQAFSALGACGGLLWSGALVTLGLSWRVSYFIFAVVSLLAAIAYCRVSFPALPCDASGGMGEIRAILSERKFYPIFLFLLLYAGAETSVCSWLVPYLTEEQSFSPLAASAVTGSVWASLFLGRLVCSRLTHLFPVRRILLFLIPGSAACVLAIPLVGGAAVWALAVLLGFFLSGTWPLIASGLVEDTAYSSGTTLSLAFLFSFFANSIMPYLLGAVGERAGLGAAILTDGGVFLLLFALFFPSQIGRKHPAIQEG